MYLCAHTKKGFCIWALKEKTPSTALTSVLSILIRLPWIEHTDVKDWVQTTSPLVSSSINTQTSLLTSVFMPRRKSLGTSIRLKSNRKRKWEIKCYLKRWFSNKTLINHCSYAPQVCFSIVVLRHNHFRGLESTGKYQKKKQSHSKRNNTQWY